MKNHTWQHMRWGLLLGVALVAGLLCSWGVSQAAGQGPADALPIPSGWQTLDVGQSVWYAFQYTGDKSQIVVDMQLSPAGSASMAVWAPDALYLWERHYPIDPTGQGTVDAARGGDLVWAGSGGFGGLWYLQIQQAGSAPANFSLSISGSGVGLDVPTPVPPTPTYSLPLPAPLIQLPTSTPEPVTSSTASTEPAGAAASSASASTAASTSSGASTSGELGSNLGGTIVFQNSSGGTIYAVNAGGSNLRQLTTGIDPAISPDGNWVAFTRWDLGGAAGSNGSLWVINVDGSGERKIMGDVAQPKAPTWSADGTQVIISFQHGGTLKETYVCLIDGDRVEMPEPVVGGHCMRQKADPLWGLRIVDVATGTFEDLPRTSHSFAPTWDPANAWHVVFHGDPGLVSLDLNQETTWTTVSSGAQHGPVFSPDGSKIATSFWQTDHWEVHVMNADGTAEARLTETPITVLIDQQLAGKDAQSWNNAAPAWSPDGSQIAYVTDRTGAYEIWIMNADGSNQHPLLSAATMDSLGMHYDGMDERMISWR